MNTNKIISLFTLSIFMLSCSSNNPVINTPKIESSANVSLNSEGIDKSISEFQKVLSSDKNNIDANINLANAYKKNNDTVNAEEYYKRAYELDKNNEKSLTSILEFYQEKGDDNNAVKYLSLLEELKKSKSSNNKNVLKLDDLEQLDIQSFGQAGISCNSDDTNSLSQVNLRNLVIEKLKFKDSSFDPNNYFIKYYKDIEAYPGLIIFTINQKSDDPKVRIKNLSQSFNEVINEIYQQNKISCRFSHSGNAKSFLTKEETTIPEEAKKSKSKRGSLNCIHDNQKDLESLNIFSDNSSFIRTDVNLKNYVIDYDIRPMEGYLPSLNLIIKENGNIQSTLTVSEILWGIKIQLLKQNKISCTVSNDLPVTIYQSEF